MNPEYSKLEERRFSQDFTAEFASFIDSNKNTAFFDKNWSSKEHRQRFSRLLANYSLNFHEFESSTLSLNGLKTKIVSPTIVDTGDQTDFSMLCETMERSNGDGLVMVYRCTELSLNSVQLLSDLHAFLKRSKSRWKIAYFGEIEGVYPPHLEQLAPDYIYTNLELAKRPSKIRFNLAMITSLGVLASLCLVTATYYWPIVERSYRALYTTTSADENIATVELSLPSIGGSEIRGWLEQDVDNWESRVAEFDKAMSSFTTDNASVRPNENHSTQGEPSSSQLPARMSDELVLAAKNGNIQFVDEQLLSGLDINIVNSNRETLLILASLNGRFDLVTWLLDHGANVGLSDNDNGSALYYASVNGHLEVAERLLINDASTTQVSKLNKTPLMAAVHNNYLALSSLLLTANSNVNQQDHSGWSALFFAIWNGNIEMTTLLLENGANASLKDKDGYTPLDIANARKNIEILKLL